MKKTIKLALFACLIVLVSALMFTACKDKDNPSNNGEQTTPIVDEITTPEETTPAPHVHTVVIDNGVPPSCTETGLTEGKHCSVCKVVLVKQEIVEATGHNFGDDLICDVCQFEKEADEISFKTLHTNGTSVSGTVSNDTTVFSFISEVAVSGKATYVVSLDIYGMQPVITKTVSLESGDNTFYILEQVDTEITLYTVTIRRRPMYTVTFDTKGGTAVASQSVEEGMCAVLPETTTKHGYNFVEWMYDFSEPITNNITISAKWAGKTYTVKYDPDGDEILNDLIVTYGADYVLETPKKEGYTFEGWFDGETKYEGGKWNKTNDTTLSPKWEINSYDVTTNVNLYQYCGDVSGAGCYQFGSTVTVVAETKALGYTWLGWYDVNDTMLSSNQTYEFILGASNIELEARWKISDEMTDFEFYSSETSCTIQGVYDKTKTTYIVPEYVTTISRNAFSGCSNMTSITIPDSVTSIGNCAFENCSSLATITLPFVEHFSSLFAVTSSGQDYKYIPESLTTVVITGGTEIKSTAFLHCNYLTSITLPASISHIGEAAFQYCEALTSIIIPDGVTSIDSRAFYGCKSLTSVTIPESVTSIGESAFSGCSNLANVYITSIEAWCKINFENISSNPLYFADNLYVNKERVTSIIIPDTIQTILPYAFSHPGFTNITIPGNVKNIGEGAFQNCSNLTSITLPYSFGTHFATETHFGYIFGAASYFENSEYVPSSLKTVTITGETTCIDEYAFYGCASLTSITIPDSVTSIGVGAFSGCSSLESITLPFVGDSVKTGKDTYQYPFGYIFGKSSYVGGEATKQYYCGSSTTSATYDTYYIPSSLKSVTIMGGNILYGAFYNCSNLTSIAIPNNITSIGEGAFRGCSSLMSIAIPNSVTSIGIGAFSYCENLTTITIPNSVSSIGEYAFSSCVNLTTITIPNSVTSIGESAFYFCTSLTSIAIPDGVTSISRSAFYGCMSLRSVTLGNGIISIGYHAFQHCSSLTSITIPDSVISIDIGAFSGCSNLIQIENGVSYVDRWVIDCDESITSAVIRENTVGISTEVFYYCDSLTSVTIPDSVTKICSYAFGHCSSLTSITFNGTKSQWQAINKISTWDYDTGKYTIYCTDGNISK